MGQTTVVNQHTEEMKERKRDIVLDDRANEVRSPAEAKGFFL
jgi:hypothetical protein